MTTQSKQMNQQLSVRFFALQLDEIKKVIKAVADKANSLPAGNEKLSYLQLNMLIQNQIHEDLKDV